MYKPVISREESARLEAAVKELIVRKGAGDDCEQLYSYVRKRTEILFYQIPLSYFYLPAEDCAEFLLSQKDHLDALIFSYRITRSCSYVSYIRNAIKLRAMIFSKRKNEKERLDFSVSLSCVQENPGYYNAAGYYPSAAERKELHDEWETDFKGIFHGIIRHAPAESPDPLKRFLSSSMNRRNMLLYIISEQDDLSLREQKELARIFNTPEHMMATLSLCMRSLMDEKRESVNLRKEYSIARHWVRYLAITNALETEEKTEKRNQLLSQQQRALKRLRILQAEYQNKKRGMSYRDMSEHLEVSVGTIVHGIRTVKNFLSTINNQEEA